MSAAQTFEFPAPRNEQWSAGVVAFGDLVERGVARGEVYDHVERRRYVVEGGQSFRFKPMSARERHIIHMVLVENPAVRSESEGQGEHRCAVIHPAKPLRSKR